MIQQIYVNVFVSNLILTTNFKKFKIELVKK
jgi:hypothetical protein